MASAANACDCRQTLIGGSTCPCELVGAKRNVGIAVACDACLSLDARAVIDELISAVCLARSLLDTRPGRWSPV